MHAHHLAVVDIRNLEEISVDCEIVIFAVRVDANEGLAHVWVEGRPGRLR